MAWADPLPGGGYRAGYRDSGGKKQYVKDANGRTVRYSRKTDARFAGAEQEAKARRRAAIKAGVQSADMPWREWWEVFNEERAFTDTDTGTTEASIVARHLDPKWGSVSLNKIGYSDVDDWVWRGELKVRPGMSEAYVRRIFGLFSVSMMAAVRKGILDASPCAGVRLPRPKKKAKPYMSPKTATSYREDGGLRSDYADAVDFDLEVGLRPGELCGLHADRIDRERGWMLVAETLVPRLRVIRPYPKDGDVRMVPLTEKAIEIIDRRLEGRDLGAGCGIPHSDGSPCHSPLVFLTTRHRPMTPPGLRHAMLKAAKAAKVERRTPYSLRRGFATRAAEGGLSAFQLAEILGHETLEQAQEYVQQTGAARMNLSAALSKYPELMVIEGGLGQNQDHGAAPGAQLGKQPPQRAAIRKGRHTG